MGQDLGCNRSQERSRDPASAVGSYIDEVTAFFLGQCGDLLRHAALVGGVTANEGGWQLRVGNDAYARITLFEIDTLRTSLDAAVDSFKELVVPEARKQEGYEGMYVMRTPEGKGLIMSLWASEDAATAGLTSGYYDEQVAKFVTLFRSPPGREHYEVVIAEPSGTVST